MVIIDFAFVFVNDSNVIMPIFNFSLQYECSLQQCDLYIIIIVFFLKRGTNA